MKKKIFPIVTFFLAIAFAVVVCDDISYRHKTDDLISCYEKKQQNNKSEISALKKESIIIQEERDELQETLWNKKLEIQNYHLDNKLDLTPLLRQQYETYEQCFLEMTYQAWGINLLYCDELELPIIRTVSEDNWNLIRDVSMVNFSTQELERIQISLCTSLVEISSLYYLPTNSDLSLAENPPESGWIEVSSDAGKYTIPLMEAEKHGSERYTAIKYTIVDDTYYGIIATGLKFQ